MKQINVINMSEDEDEEDKYSESNPPKDSMVIDQEAMQHTLFGGSPEEMIQPKNLKLSPSKLNDSSNVSHMRTAKFGN